MVSTTTASTPMMAKKASCAEVSNVQLMLWPTSRERSARTWFLVRYVSVSDRQSIRVPFRFDRRCLRSAGFASGAAAMGACTAASFQAVGAYGGV